MAILNCVSIILVVHACIQFALCELDSKTAYPESAADDVPKDELVFAHVIYRHGNRSILYRFDLNVV